MFLVKYSDIQIWFENHARALIFTCVIILIAFVISFLIKFFTLKIKKMNNKRSYTLAKLIENICKYIIIIIAAFSILATWGVNVTAALAGVGIFGLVIGLGAQDLIKDFIAGIGIVLDNQYEIDEVVEVNGFKGKVIEIGLRNTKLINANGEIRIIRNGMISQVSNFSRSFSVAAINVDILYNENIDNVIELLNEKLPLLKENYNQIIEGPIVAGVDELKNNAVSIRITAKTEAEEHYAVRRALLKYTKEIFEENNIKIPTNKIIIREEKENE